ncbi:MAG: hypothetical protein CME59_12130 [Halioglobus sp.]|nr:hypothetical protein [Halioglobus sp.]|tara:strand:- start:206 stop:472 length:267 start_codon:yes stop_codon:yes gene_type:complete
MQQQNLQDGRVRRTVNDVVMAEMFLVQATIESATAIGEGINALGRQIAGAGNAGEDSLQDTLQRIRSRALEPYTSRFGYLLELRRGED